MRKPYDAQRRFDLTPIAQLNLNFRCRDELIPVLAGLKYLYTNSKLRQKLVQLVAGDINESSRRDVGRPGFDDWQVVVLAAVRLGCNYDYDHLHDLAENHRSIRILLGRGDWDEEEKNDFGPRRIGNTLDLLKPATIAALNQAIVQHGQQLHGEADQSVRADSFVVETNIHYPTESTLIGDGMRKIIPLCVKLAEVMQATGWRQSNHLFRKIKSCVRTIAQISGSQSPKTKAGLPRAYEKLLKRSSHILEKAKTLQKHGEAVEEFSSAFLLALDLKLWIGLTEQVCDTARRRVLLKEKVPNNEKLFSLFETHTQLYRRGKAGELNQFGRLVMVYEDGAGFISHYHLLDREASDAGVVVEQTRIAQKKHRGAIQSASFDRGFHSAENVEELKKIVEEPCLAPKHPGQYAECLEKASVSFHRLRQRHSGVESAIGALQSGNGLKRCRDRGELGFARYLGLAILGRNIHTLGKLLIAREDPLAPAAHSKRTAA